MVADRYAMKDLQVAVSHRLSLGNESWYRKRDEVKGQDQESKSEGKTRKMEREDDVDEQEPRNTKEDKQHVQFSNLSLYVDISPPTAPLIFDAAYRYKAPALAEFT